MSFLISWVDLSGSISGFLLALLYMLKMPLGTFALKGTSTQKNPLKTFPNSPDSDKFHSKSSFSRFTLIYLPGTFSMLLSRILNVVAVTQGSFSNRFFLVLGAGPVQHFWYTSFFWFFFQKSLNLSFNFFSRFSI